MVKSEKYGKFTQRNLKGPSGFGNQQITGYLSKGVLVDQCRQKTDCGGLRRDEEKEATSGQPTPLRSLAVKGR